MTEPNITEAHDTETDYAVPGPSWTVSLCFWTTLICAATIYATVALAPKFCVWNEVRLEYRQNIARLVELEDDVAYLERVEAALKTDPEFRNQIAGVSESLNDEEEFIPVSGSLLFGQNNQLETISDAPRMPAYHAMTVQLASHASLRASLLTLAACLTIFAFTFLNDAGTDFVNATGRLIRSAALIPAARYFAITNAKTAKPNEEE